MDSKEELAGLNPGDKVLIEAFKGELIVRKVYSIDGALEMPKIASKTPKSLEIIESTPESLEEDIKIERTLQEKCPDDGH